MKRSLADHAIIITGASDGIGAELARQLAGQGTWLALAARRAHELDVVAQQCIARGGRAIVVQADVTDPVQCEHLVARTMESFGKVDALINNAGVGAHFRVEDTTDLGVYEHVMRVNYLSSVYMTHYALPELRKSRGRIVAISSLAAKTGVPERAAYAASKHAMQGFFESLRIELATTGVTVTVINPGFVRSSIRANALGKDDKPLGEHYANDDVVMPVEECARQAVIAIEGRKREIVMRAWWKLAAILKVVAPGIIDGIASRAVARKENGK